MRKAQPYRHSNKGVSPKDGKDLPSQMARNLLTIFKNLWKALEETLQTVAGHCRKPVPPPQESRSPITGQMKEKMPYSSSRPLYFCTFAFSNHLVNNKIISLWEKQNTSS